MRKMVLFLTILYWSETTLAADSSPGSSGFFDRFSSWFSSDDKPLPDLAPPSWSEAMKDAKPKIELQTSPPVWLFYNRFLATIGLDPEIKITPLEKVMTGFYRLKVTVLGKNTNKIEGLACLLGRNREVGGAMVETLIFNENEERVLPMPFPEELVPAMKLVNEALSGNPYYLKIQEGNHYYDFFIEFCSDKLVQFPADMQNDHYGNANEVAALAFYRSLNLEDLNQSLSFGERRLNICTSTALKPFFNLPFEQPGIKWQTMRQSYMRSSAGDL